MLAVFDPVGIGVVKSLERPGTNVTGTTMYAPQLIGERLRMLKRIVPNLDKAAMALNGNNANNAAQFELLRSEAQKLGIAVESWTFESLRTSTQRLIMLWHSGPKGS
jgi:putative tryptophan/tyrosine transport system substrate-binding protein